MYTMFEALARERPRPSERHLQHRRAARELAAERRSHRRELRVRAAGRRLRSAHRGQAQRAV